MKKAKRISQAGHRRAMVTGLAASIVDESEREYVNSSSDSDTPAPDNMPRKLSFTRRRTSSMNSYEAASKADPVEFEAYSDNNSEKHQTNERLNEDDF